MSDLNYKIVRDAILKNARKYGIKPIKMKPFSNKEKADYIRRLNIDTINYFKDSHIYGRSEERDADILKAYEMMSDKEILASEKREDELDHEELVQYLKDIQEFERQSRNSTGGPIIKARNLERVFA